MGTYNYKILREVGSIEEVPDGATLYYELDDEEAKTPDAAALAAAEKIGKIGSYRPISARHFNETNIVPTTGLMVGSPPSVAAAPEPAEPEPGEQPGEGDGEQQLADGLDPEHACETEGCGHLPAEHGVGGVGMCRVDECPCGGYTPEPA